jgi:WhiB family redox-sensing transcriptional regulator
VLTRLQPEIVMLDPQTSLDPLAKECPDDVPCRVQDPDLWFAETPAELEQAKALCLGCPARLACLTGAVERREPWGVWGGEIFERGAIVARKRPRGRPRGRPRKTDPNEVAA